MTPKPHALPAETHRLHFAWTLGTTVLLYGLLYRARLFYNLYYASPPYRAFDPDRHSFVGLLQALWTEWAWAIQVAAVGWLCWAAGMLLLSQRRRLQRFFVTVGWLVLHVFFITGAFLYGSHLRAMFAVQSGLTYDLWSEGVDAFGPRDLLSFLSLTDVIYLTLPWLLFWLLWKLPLAWRPWRNRVVLSGSLALLLFALLPLSSRAAQLDKAVTMTPIQFLVTDYLATMKALRKPDSLAMTVVPSTRKPPLPEHRRQPLPTRRRPDPPARMPWHGRSPEQTIRLIHPAFIQPKVIPKTIPQATPQPAKTQAGTKTRWNVLFYMLESVGTRYIFDRSRSRRMPMKFLQTIANQGWYFTNHYASANSSPRAIFSILTGLYPSPQLEMFEMKQTVCAPSLYDFVRKQYSSFFITPGSLRWYFPRHFFLNNGPETLLGARKFRRFKRYGSFPNEIDVTTELIRRTLRMKEPFLASYLSFLPHGPYDDYGPKYRIIRNTRRDINRYYNNLYVLDLQIKRLFQALQKAGLLERTILVFVGDHGQAFGQHRRNWGHSRLSYNENYHAPLIFYQPRLFKPRVITRRTSHVDILPTLLDVMKISYEPLLFQGESLFQRSFHRKQIFMYGNESTLSLIDQEQIKMQYLTKRRRCWVYDLNKDPNEKHRLPCQPFAKQRNVMRQYLQQQRRLRQQYNKTCRQKRPFYGLKHPGLW